MTTKTFYALANSSIQWDYAPDVVSLTIDEDTYRRLQAGLDLLLANNICSCSWSYLGEYKFYTKHRPKITTTPITIPGFPGTYDNFEPEFEVNHHDLSISSTGLVTLTIYREDSA